jgi:UDP-glucose:(heptosyl)LPS alpha-1,3-glucosyltransferase
MTSAAPSPSLVASRDANVLSAPSSARKLRIAFVTPSLLEARGTERVTAELLRRLAPEHEVCLFVRDGFPPQGVSLCLHRIARVPGPGLIKFLGFYALASRAVRAAAKQHREYDVVYSPGPNCAQADVVTAHFCQARQLELLRSGEHCPRAANWLDRAVRANRWLYASVVSRLERAFYSSRQRRVLTPSQLLARDLIDYYGLFPAQAVCVPFGVDREFFNSQRRLEIRTSARQELGLGADDSTFLFMGNNWLIKGLLYVLRALAEVPAAKLLVVGADVERAASWQRAAKESGVDSRVKFLPRRSDVMFYYAAADALVAPSVYDTFGLMPLEAAACGLPAIITRSMGVAEVFTPEETTVLERADDVPALAAAMRRLQADAGYREELGCRALLRATQSSWDRSCQPTLDLLVQFAQERKSAAGRAAP